MDNLKFLQEIAKLKNLKRTGWIERGVKDPETVASHSFMVAIEALIFSKGKDLNIEKILKMAIIHDIVESQTGDLITKENWSSGGTITEKEKHALEKKAIKSLLNLLDPDIAKEFMGLWLEFENQETKESKFLKELDKFDAVFQALVYHDGGNHKKPFDGFWDDNKLNWFNDPDIKNLLMKAIKNKK